MSGNNEKSEITSMWGGRFSGPADEFMKKFGASIDFDIQLLDVDIDASKAWAEALHDAGILAGEELSIITDGLERVRVELKKQNSFDYTLEDVHMTVEAKLTELIGEAGAKLHTGRSRNDQVATDERLLLMECCPRIVSSIEALQRSIVAQAEDHIDDIVPSYTHLQQAQPVRLGHYIMMWYWMLERDKGRINDAYKRLKILPLGSGAVAGTGFNIDRIKLAKKLGFDGITENSMDATSDRDYIIEFISAVSMLMLHLSRISEDIIIWSSREFRIAELSDTYSTGSSMMPQKKNPDSLELVRGKTARVYGNLMSLFTLLKGLPFSYSKDMQEDKEPLFDTIVTAEGVLRIMMGVIESISFDTVRMREMFDDMVFATDVADYLTKKGLPFRKAHEVTGKIVKYCTHTGVEISKLTIEQLKEYSDLFDDDIYSLFNLDAACDNRNVYGGTSKSSVKTQIQKALELLDG